jgi:hypothetical protein
MHFSIPITAIVLALATLAPAAAKAQGKLDARYTASLAGLTIGKGAWVVDIAEDQYTAAVSGMTSGVLRIFTGGQGTGAVTGYVTSGFLLPSSYAMTLIVDKKTEELRIALSAGNVKEFSIDPPVPPNPERIPVTETHRRGVSDPMTASLVRVPGNGDPLSTEACGRTTAVFDGRMRYDLNSTFKRVQTVKAERGYAGSAVVCSIAFTPIAGYLPDRAAIKYLMAQRDMEIWLAPIAGTRVLAPFRFTVPTPLGVGTLQATQFISSAQPPRLTPTSAKSQ